MGGNMGLNRGMKFAELNSNSRRLEQRFIRTMETLSKQPDKPIWFCSENLNREEILRTHREQTIRRTVQSGEMVLLIQDAMSLNYRTHLLTEGIGYISSKTLGVNIHPCLAVNGGGMILGAFVQSSYNRE